jgi:hypothetical protein
MRTTLGATAFAVAANALESLLATSGGCARGVMVAAPGSEAAAAGAGLATCCASRALAVGVTPFPSQDPSKLEKPAIPMIADLRSVMLAFLLSLSTRVR